MNTFKILFALWILLAVVAFSSCQKINFHVYHVKEGECIFKPLRFIEPHVGTMVTGRVSFGEEWFDQLTTSKAHGLKLTAIGKYDYHDEGMNFQVMWDIDSSKLVMKARYYIPLDQREESETGLRVIDCSAFDITQDEMIYWRLCAYKDRALWYINDELVAEVPIHFDTPFVTPPHLGSQSKGHTALRDMVLGNYKVW